MDPTSSVADEPKPQPEVRAPQSQSPPSPARLKSESRSQRRSAFWRNPRMKWGSVFAALVILAAIGIGGSMYLSYAAEREYTDDAQIDGHIYPVSAMIDGTVLDVLFDNNQYVQAGTVLGHIDPRFYQAALDKARGDLAEANATVK